MLRFVDAWARKVFPTAGVNEKPKPAEFRRTELVAIGTVVLADCTRTPSKPPISRVLLYGHRAGGGYSGNKEDS